MADSQVYPVTAILGPRQSGKTTLVRAIFPESRYVNLEHPETREYAQTDPRGFLAEGNDRLVIDEFQRVPALLSYIQTIVDERKAPGQFVLTGSQNFLMMERISQSLAGRVALFTLLPFSLAELSEYGAGIPERDEVLFRGLYPRLYEVDADTYRYYGNYIQTYLERDVRQLKNVTDLSLFQGFLRLCAGRVGQVVNFSSLADDAGISHNTAKAWLSVLQAGHIVFPLRPYYRNFHKQTIKSPKAYFVDTGLLCHLLGLDSPRSLATHHAIGGIFENLVVGELMKYRLNRGRESNLFYWRDKRGREVDILLEWGDRRTAIEVKSGRTISSSYFASLAYYGELDSGCPPESRFVVYGGDESQDRTNAHVRGWRSLTACAEAFGV